MNDEPKSKDMDPEEIIIHTKDYDINIKKKLLNFLKKLGVTFETRFSHREAEGMSKEDLDRLINIEMACCHRNCVPCTYPNCQRFVREQMLIRKITC